MKITTVRIAKDYVQEHLWKHSYQRIKRFCGYPNDPKVLVITLGIA